MKIIFAIDSIHRGGKERQMFILAKALMNNGHMLKIAAKRMSSENYLSEYAIDRSIVSEYAGNGWLDEFRNFKQILLSDSPDIVVSWDSQTSFYSLVLYNKYNYKFINASIQHGIRLLRFSQFFRSIVCHLSPNIVANSIAGLSANNLKLGENRVVLFNGIENKFINNLSVNEIKKRKEQLISGFSENPGTVYISVANLVPYKDYFTVLKALKKLKEKRSFYYFIIGDGPMRNEIIQLINEYGLDKNIFLIGNIDNVSDYLFISDILIHSSRGEGISNAILEGMFAGLPIVATKVGGVPETVFPGSSLLFPYKDSEKLYHCLMEIDKLKASFNPQSDEYKQHLALFSLEKMVNRFEEILKEVIEK